VVKDLKTVHFLVKKAINVKMTTDNKKCFEINDRRG
jgi:hypothetical protein